MEGSLGIYLVRLKGVDLGYDSYSEFVCFAYSEEEALNTHPSGSNSAWSNKYDSTWVKKSQVKDFLTAARIGKASKQTVIDEESRVILASFHAG
jgi:hypothetical protein